MRLRQRWRLPLSRLGGGCGGCGGSDGRAFFSTSDDAERFLCLGIFWGESSWDIDSSDILVRALL